MRALILTFCVMMGVVFYMFYMTTNDALKSAETMRKNSEIACKACVDKGGIPIMDGLRMRECMK